VEWKVEGSVDTDTLLVLAVTHWVILQASETEDLYNLEYFLVQLHIKDPGYNTMPIIEDPLCQNILRVVSRQSTKKQ
jgi:hypothetical protein